MKIGRSHESGRREHLLGLILMDPWTRDGDQAAALLEGILGLPYHEAMRRHFDRKRIRGPDLQGPRARPSAAAPCARSAK